VVFKDTKAAFVTPTPPSQGASWGHPLCGWRIQWNCNGAGQHARGEYQKRAFYKQVPGRQLAERILAQIGALLEQN